MKSAATIGILLLGVVMTAPAAAQHYEARRNGDIVQLEDKKNQTVVSIITSVGNMAYEMKVKGQNVLRFPFASIDDFRAKPPGLHGIPLLAPWAQPARRAGVLRQRQALRLRHAARQRDRARFRFTAS